MSSYDSDWTLDICLSCDAYSTSGPYCSQACRMLDLQRADPSHYVTTHGKKKKQPSSTSTSSASSNPASSSNSGNRASGVQLPPSVDFSSYKKTGHDAHPPSARTSKRSSIASVSSYSSTDSAATPSASPVKRYSQPSYGRNRDGLHPAPRYSKHAVYGSTWS